MTKSTTRVPSLAELAADPAKIATLTLEVATAFGAAFSELATSCALQASLLSSKPQRTHAKKARR